MRLCDVWTEGRSPAGTCNSLSSLSLFFFCMKHTEQCTSSKIKKTKPKNTIKALLLLCSPLTASIPDSCIPMLTTTMVRTCQRTERSMSRRRTERVLMEERDRCSSCISSTSAWMFPFLRKHLRAGEQTQLLNFTARKSEMTKKRSAVSDLKRSRGHFPSQSAGTVDSLETMATASAGPK